MREFCTKNFKEEKKGEGWDGWWRKVKMRRKFLLPFWLAYMKQHMHIKSK
jgi:hypothetical protein